MRIRGLMQSVLSLEKRPEYLNHPQSVSSRGATNNSLSLLAEAGNKPRPVPYRVQP